MKKTVFYGAFTALALCFIFSACSGVGLKAPSNTEANQSDNKYEIIGTISFSDSSRTAVTSLQMPAGVSLSANDFVFGIKNLNSSNSENAGSVVAVIDSQTSTISYKATFKEPGRYVIACSLWNDAFYGKTQDFQVTATTTQAPVIRLRPYEYRSASSNNNLLGEVDLTINDQSGKLDSVTFKGDVYKPVHADTAAANNSFKEARTIKFSEGQARIQLSDVQPYSYEVTFTFNDSVGNPLYSTKEIVVVLPNFVTDTWLPATEFTITNQMIDVYGFEIVPSTNYLIYGKKYDQTSQFGYYITNSLTDFVSSELPENPTFTRDQYYSDTNFCFDSKGYYYVITKDSESYQYIKSNNPEFGEPGENYVTGDPRNYETLCNFGQCFSIDCKTDVIYYCDTGYACITKIQDDDGTMLDGTTAISYYLKDNGNRFNDDFNGRFVINNKIAYFPSSVDGEYYFNIANLNTAFNDGQDFVVEIQKYEMPSFVKNYDSNTVFSDLLYQDGYVYLLLRYVVENPTQNMDFYSTGGVFRFNTFTNQFDDNLVGFAEPIMPSDDAYVELKDSSGNNLKTNGGLNLYAKVSDIVYTDAYYSYDPDWTYALNFYAPYTEASDVTLTLSNKAFYGPQKFIAIKPKKLVIADDGIAFYIDADGVYKYKNVNRVVVVDLEKFSEPDIEFESYDTSVEFDYIDSNGSKYVGPNIPRYANASYWNNYLKSDIPIYINNSNVYESYSGIIGSSSSSYTIESKKLFTNTDDAGWGASPSISREDYLE